MSLPRTDLGKVHFNEPEHEMIDMLSTEAGLSKKAWVEKVIGFVCARAAKKTILRSDRIRRSGIEKIYRESEFASFLEGLDL